VDQVKSYHDIDHTAILLEFSVVTNREKYFAAASSKKITRYDPLLSDLECSGLLVELKLGA